MRKSLESFKEFAGNALGFFQTLLGFAHIIFIVCVVNPLFYCFYGARKEFIKIFCKIGFHWNCEVSNSHRAELTCGECREIFCIL